MPASGIILVQANPDIVVPPFVFGACQRSGDAIARSHDVAAGIVGMPGNIRGF
jgi:hypothetical protein